METIKLDKWEQHLILYCKLQYRNHKTDFFEGLKMIWAIRCGYNYRPNQDNHIYPIIADTLYEIIIKTQANKASYLMEIIHKEITKDLCKPKNMSAIQKLIWEYGSIIQCLAVKTKIDDKWYNLIELPKKPLKRVFNRILRGNGRYTDHEIITNSN